MFMTIFIIAQSESNTIIYNWKWTNKHYLEKMLVRSNQEGNIDLF